ncbi:hypothetical protein T4D_7958 [Trichinella pseudospiralis]|uniref:Uncharacterized protein n=1 Tax=Trichinella pseudospiralis TaxID=6337 RepID=A0A0V1FMX5_TRIPS|nr:hypothetical protein T4D_7958 [Trichinella pseudospiralis]
MAFSAFAKPLSGLMMRLLFKCDLYLSMCEDNYNHFPNDFLKYLYKYAKVLYLKIGYIFFLGCSCFLLLTSLEFNPTRGIGLMS